jgi:Kef-type K+ transport system membrane component KefB
LVLPLWQFVNPTGAITSIAELGAIFLLFAVGLEMHPEHLIRIGRKALAVALSLAKITSCARH